jgi:hypothetical protein
MPDELDPYGILNGDGEYGSEGVELPLFPDGDGSPPLADRERPLDGPAGSRRAGDYSWWLTRPRRPSWP